MKVRRVSDVGRNDARAAWYPSGGVGEAVSATGEQHNVGAGPAEPLRGPQTDPA